MPFLCYLCGKERVYTTYMCPTCDEIKKIVDAYNKDDVLSILRTCCFRNQEQIGYKVKSIISKDNDKTIKKSTKPSSPPQTRSKKKTSKTEV